MATKSSELDIRKLIEAIRSQFGVRYGMEDEQFSLQIDGLCTRDLYGYTFPDRNTPGILKVRALDERGRTLEGHVSYVDSQSEISAETVGETVAADSDNRVAAEIAGDPLSPIQARVDAIRQWLIESPADASQFILEALPLSDSLPEFRNDLVFLAEDARYDEACDRESLASVLKKIAREIVATRQSNLDYVAWSAIRRFASLVTLDRIGELTLFLSNTGAIDTRLVALQSVLSACESQPLMNTAAPELRDRIFTLASKLVDADVLVPGENSAVLELSICALAALSDPRFEECVRQVQSLGWPWLTMQVMNGLTELKSAWEQNSPDQGYSAAIGRVAAILAAP